MSVKIMLVAQPEQQINRKVMKPATPSKEELSQDILNGIYDTEAAVK